MSGRAVVGSAAQHQAPKGSDHNRGNLPGSTAHKHHQQNRCQGDTGPLLIRAQ